MNSEKRPWRWEENGETVTRSIALGGSGCHSNACGVRLHVRDGRLVKVTGDPDFPLSRGRLCPRCRALPEVVYHPDRLKYPLRRVGERGENRWQRVSWDEAYDEIAGRFNIIKQEYGPESVQGHRKGEGDSVEGVLEQGGQEGNGLRALVEVAEDHREGHEEPGLAQRALLTLRRV